ncbi:hypothetical protein GXP65_02880 [Vibrio campbellii]|uniref:hypothetical protein n=1 Tax=Vibrio sp. LB10LO1 TaxID=2711207 RepID=UPI0013896FF2|nr:hypothetical protein [Vibrio sp. LB10LO1]NDJ79952.1 hypothetical protein [Vibrio sp. LB10LO1]
MRIALTFFLMVFSIISNADQSVEDKLFTDLNNSIDALGSRIAVCSKISTKNKPDEETLKFAKQRLKELTPVLAHINYLAIERCSFSEKKELAYSMLIAKNNAKRQSTLELVKATEKMTFPFNTESQAKFDALSGEIKTFLTNSSFFSKPFDVLAFYESVADM